MADLDNWARPASENGERTYHVPAQVGDTFQQDFELQGQRIELLGKVTGLEPNAFLSFEHLWNGSSLGIHFVFEPLSGGTKLTGKGEGYTSGLLKMFETFVETEANREIEANLNHLKSLLESETPDDS